MANNVQKRSGWVTFAGIAALIAGGYNSLSGIAALTDDDTVAAQAQEVLYGIDLTAWGWFWLIVGLAQLTTGARFSTATCGGSGSAWGARASARSSRFS